jgi:hypothetical protein
MLSLNATICIYAGGNSTAGPDYNQLLVQLPSADYALDQSAGCKTAVKVGYIKYIIQYRVSN